MKKIVYTTHGTCSRVIFLTIDDSGRIADVSFIGGCNGNLQGICRLVKGMDAEEARRKLDGIMCGDKGTSCPDQLAKAINEALEKA